MLDLHEWREQSRITHGFSDRKAIVFCSRKATAEEEKDYAEFTRMYYCVYEEIDTLIADEERIAGKEFACNLRNKYNQIL